MSVHWCWGLTVQSIVWSLHRPQQRRLLSLVGSGTVPPWCCEIAGLYEVSVIGLIHNTSCSTHTWQAHLLLLHTHTHDIEQEHWDAQTDLTKPGGLISTLKGGGGGLGWLPSVAKDELKHLCSFVEQPRQNECPSVSSRARLGGRECGLQHQGRMAARLQRPACVWWKSALEEVRSAAMWFLEKKQVTRICLQLCGWDRDSPARGHESSQLQEVKMRTCR